VGHRLRPPFAGSWSARRGTYHVRYRIDESRHAVIVLDIIGRADAYYPGRA
jgi:mRNA interferase RelE/StbE